MLHKTTLERLQGLKLPGFVDALVQQMQSKQYLDLSFEDRLTLLIDGEYSRRLDASTRRMLKEANLPSHCSLEAVDFTIERGIKKRVILELAQPRWCNQGTNVIITGPTGTGKTFLSCSLAHNLVLQGSSVRFKRTNMWCHDLESYSQRQRLLQTCVLLRKVPLLIFDEWLLDPLSRAEARLFLELFESRFQRASCMFITQLPVTAWHARFEDKTLADAILDRVIHNAVRLDLTGESIRKLRAPNLAHFTEPGEETSLRSDNTEALNP